MVMAVANATSIVSIVKILKNESPHVVRNTFREF